MIITLPTYGQLNKRHNCSLNRDCYFGYESRAILYLLLYIGREQHTHYTMICSLSLLMHQNNAEGPEKSDIFIAPAYRRVRYRSPNFHPSTFTSKFDIYVEVFVFSALVIAVTVKPYIVIVLDIPFKHTP